MYMVEKYAVLKKNELDLEKSNVKNSKTIREQ